MEPKYKWDEGSGQYLVNGIPKKLHVLNVRRKNILKYIDSIPATESEETKKEFLRQLQETEEAIASYGKTERERVEERYEDARKELEKK